MKEIRWGMIGCGDVTEIKSGPGFQKAAHSRLAAVMRRNGELAEDYARRHDVPRWYDNADRLLEDPEVDAVYIATPPDSHMDYAIRCAKAGKPVYVEKPMARNHEECRRMIEACREAGVPLFVAYYRRSLERFLKVKKLVEGKIGTVRYVSVKLHQPATQADKQEEKPWRVVPEIAGGGKFVDMASHTLDLLDFLLGPIREVAGAAANQAGLYEAEDMVSARFVFESGVHGVGVWSFASFSDEDVVEIVGSCGKVKFSCFGNEPIEFITKAGVKTYDIVNPIFIQQPMIQTIVDELNGEGKCPSTGESAARTSKVMDALLQAYRQENK